MIQELEQQLSQLFKEQPIVLLNCNVYKKDILTLRYGEWLSSEAIHLLMSILQAQSKGKAKCLDPFVTSMILFMGEDPILETLKQQNLLQYDYLLIPSNTDTKNSGKGSHWFLMCYCKATQTIYEFDSSYECIHSNAVSMKEKIERMYMLFEEKNVEVKVKRVEKVIKQTNNYDCGIFVVAYSQLIIKQVGEKQEKEVDIQKLDLKPQWFQDLRSKYYAKVMYALATNKIQEKQQ